MTTDRKPLPGLLPLETLQGESLVNGTCRLQESAIPKSQHVKRNRPDPSAEVLQGSNHLTEGN